MEIAISNIRNLIKIFDARIDLKTVLCVQKGASGFTKHKDKERK